MEDNKNKVYKENFLGEPTVDKKALAEENEKFLNSSTKTDERLDILFNKVMRIEKSIYFVITIITVFFLVMLFLIAG